MASYCGKYDKSQNTAEKEPKGLPFVLIILAFFFIELFAFCFLSEADALAEDRLRLPVFGGLWAVILGAAVYILPGKASRTVFGILFFSAAVYAGFQTGYYILFSQMMWLSDFRYATEGADYADVLLSYPLQWWLGIAGMIALGVLLLRRFPMGKRKWYRQLLLVMLAAAAAMYAYRLPQKAFVHDKDIRYAGSDYGRSQSAEAAYVNMFNTHRLYQICGLYQTLAKDIYANAIYPMTPTYALEQKREREEISRFFGSKDNPVPNDMTGLLAGKNVVLVLMESMDDWMIGEHTPTLVKLMSEGIEFTNFYTPGYGGIRTFNTEFAINTGSFLSSQGGYAFDYVTNSYKQSLANQLRQAGYSAKTFHYNDPTFYSRGEFSPAMGYEAYVCYDDYLDVQEEKERKNLLYDDLLLFDNPELNGEFFREGKPTLNFIITRSAHLSYKYNEVLSHWGLEKYPQYRGLTGNEETDCAYLKAKLVDDLFARLLDELSDRGQLENTVIIGVTDHYTYGYKDMDSLYALSGVEEELLLEKTPCFIWSPGLAPQKVHKVLNTSDLLPTVLNLLGVKSRFEYIGRDAFDEKYAGFVPFSDGSWIFGDTAFDVGEQKYFSVSGGQHEVSANTQRKLHAQVQEFVRINNLILESDYYRKGR